MAVIYLMAAVGLIGGIIIGSLVMVYTFAGDRQQEEYGEEQGRGGGEEPPEEPDEAEAELSPVEPVARKKKRTLHDLSKDLDSWTDMTCDEADLDTADYIEQRRKRETGSYNYLKQKM